MENFELMTWRHNLKGVYCFQFPLVRSILRKFVFLSHYGDLKLIIKDIMKVYDKICKIEDNDIRFQIIIPLLQELVRW